MSSPEVAIDTYCAVGDELNPADDPRDVNGQKVRPEDVTGTGLKEPNQNVQVFFLGFGDADINIGSILADATDAEYHQVSSDDDLAEVIEELSGYF